MQNLVQLIKEQGDIVELIGDHVPLKRAGASYVGKCPFHNDTKPSMNVSPQKGIFKCFSCGAGGDIIKFWSEFHHKSFKETLVDLANRYGITIEEQQNDQNYEDRNLWLKLHRLAAEYYNKKLLAAGEAELCRNYLKDRQISSETITKFNLGYAPEAWTGLIEYLQQKTKVSEEDLFRAGLAGKSPKSGKVYDRFRARLMIPIYSDRDECIAFGARILVPDDKQAKYLNSADSQIYHKGSNLYGLNLAKEHIRKEDAVILVEGYFDLITLVQAGIKNCVANQGTALTSRQARLLMKYTMSKKVYLCLDNDRAGMEAASKAYQVIMKELEGLGADIRVIDLGEAKDPDEYIVKYGAEQLKNTINNAAELMQYQINKLCAGKKRADYHEKDELIKKLATFMAHIKSANKYSYYQQEIEKALDLDQSVVKSELSRQITIFKEQELKNSSYNSSLERDMRAPTRAKLTSPSGLSARKTKSEINLAYDHEMLALLLIENTLIEDFMNEEESLLFNESSRIILDSVLDVCYENPDLKDIDVKFNYLQTSILNEYQDNQDFSEHLAEISQELDKNGELIKLKVDLKTKYDNLKNKMKIIKLEDKRKKMLNRLSELEDNSKVDLDPAEIPELMNSYKMITIELENLKAFKAF
jgi:DNA primase